MTIFQLAVSASISLPTFAIRVPASTSNCGPGFDSLGIAFTLYNEVTLTPRADGEIRYVGNHSRFQAAEREMVHEVVDAFFARAGVARFGFSFNINGEIPLARGLGSSVTVRAGLLGGLNAAAGAPLSRDDIIGIVSSIEGHPDNAAAAVFGGFCVARMSPRDGRYIGAIRFEVDPDLVFVVAAPDLEIRTSASRNALPAHLPFGDVVRSLNSLACIVSIFATRDYPRLRDAVNDFIHQPYRLPSIPGARQAIDSGVAAGAYAGWLSGSGSSVLCVCEKELSARVGEAMVAAFSRSGAPAKLHLLRADNDGLVIRRPHTRTAEEDA